jgi:hypothetical protein
MDLHRDLVHRVDWRLSALMDGLQMGREVRVRCRSAAIGRSERRRCCIRAGGRVAVYVEEHPKYVDITVECYENTIICATNGMRKLTVANA